MTVAQIDLARRTIRLNPGETKSGQGREAVMTSSTAALIKACCAGKSGNDYVFTREDGQRIRDFRGVWRTITRAAGLPRLHVHDLRRSAIRRMIQSVIPQHVAMQLSGHRTISVFHRYAIVSHSDLQDAARKLERKSTDTAHSDGDLETTAVN